MKKAKLLNQRKKHGLTQQDVASSLGITTSSYCRIENGKALLSEPILIRLCKIYDCNIAELLEFSENGYQLCDKQEIDYARLFACLVDMHEVHARRLDQFHNILGPAQ